MVNSVCTLVNLQGGKIVLNMHQIYFRPFWLTLRDALALIKYVLGVG